LVEKATVKNENPRKKVSGQVNESSTLLGISSNSEVFDLKDDGENRKNAEMTSLAKKFEGKVYFVFV
jgi:hypothetical protein